MNDNVFDKKDNEIIEASELSILTVNKIREIVDQLDMDAVNSSKEFISISIGDPTRYPHLKPAKEITELIVSIVKGHEHDGYGPSMGLDEARHAIAKRYTYKDIPFKVHENDVFLTCGCSGAIDLAFASVLNRHDVILVPSPGFPLYLTMCNRYGYVPVFYECDKNDHWSIDIEKLSGTFDKLHSQGIVIKGMLINNPSNPCGSVFTKRNLLDALAIVQKASRRQKRQCVLIADEIYSGMVYGDTKMVPLGTIAYQFNLCVMTLGGLAKQYLVPGWRVGWVVIHDGSKNKIQSSQLKTALSRLSTVILGPCTLIQAAIPRIFSDVKMSYYDNLNGILKKQSDLMAHLFGKIDGLKPVPAQGAMYLLVAIDIEKLDDSINNDIEFANTLLKEEAVLVLPGAIFDIPNYFRAVTCPQPRLIKEVANRLKSFFQRHRAISIPKSKL